MKLPFRVRVIFRWYDIWVGLYIDKCRRTLYFFPVPMLGFKFTKNNVDTPTLKGSVEIMGSQSGTSSYRDN